MNPDTRLKDETMNQKQLNIIRFSLSFLLANFEDAYEDLDDPPTLEQVKEIYKFIADQTVNATYRL
jgi:hypothetical protein